MYRASLRSVSRPALSGLRTAVRAPRRFASTASPADKSRSWKSSGVRWGLAAGAVYYYSTSSVFADEAPADMVPPPAVYSDDDMPTVDAIVEQKRKQIQQKAEQSEKKQPKPSKSDDSPQTGAQSSVVADGSPAALEEEAGQEGAFNPETGEINWDCPCLGGMADGPCGEDFKTAFSCFVFSEEEPKGMDCIDKFQGMQECFKKYPEIYGSELQDDEEGEGVEGLPEGEVSSEKAEQKPVQERQAQQPKSSDSKDNSAPTPTPTQPEVNAEEEVIPEPVKVHDATAANKKALQELEQEKSEKKEEKKE